MSRSYQRVLVSLLLAVVAHILMLWPVLNSSVAHPAIRPIRTITISLGEDKPTKCNETAPKESTKQKNIPVKQPRRLVRKNTRPLQPSVAKKKIEKIVRRQIKERGHHRQTTATKEKSIASLEHRLSIPNKALKFASNTPVVAKDGSQNGEMISSVAVRVTQKATPLYKINSPPRYPRIARRRELEGTVIIEVLVDIRGRVSKAVVAVTSGCGILDHAALKAINSWVFKPGNIDGNKQSMWVRVPIIFQLNS